jgi:hypothetical protein
MNLTMFLHLVLMLRMSGALPLLHVQTACRAIRTDLMFQTKLIHTSGETSQISS